MTSAPGSVSSRYSRASVRAWRLRSGGIASPLRRGSSRSPKSTTIAIVPDQERDADERELEEPEGLDARVLRRGIHDHVDRRPRQGEHRPRVRAEREREQQLRRRPAQADREHDHHRHQRGDRAVDTDQRRQRGDEQHHQHDEPRPALPCCVDQALTGPDRDAGRVEGRAHDEQRRDEDDRRIAEAGDRLPEIEDARRAERERRADCHDLDGQVVPDEEHHRDAENHERDRAVAHARRDSDVIRCVQVLPGPVVSRSGTRRRRRPSTESHRMTT